MSSPAEWPSTTRGRLHGVRTAGSIALVMAAAAGCASAPPSEVEIAYARSMSPSVEMATDPTQEAALERAAALPAGEATSLGDGAVVAGPIYAAASGRRCRAMIFGSQRRLACESLRAEGWVFVPDVFGEPPTGGPELMATPTREGAQ